MPQVIFLQEDVTGLLPDNFIQDEKATIQPGSYRILLTEYGAFFEEDFELRDASTNDLIDTDDYYFSDLYQEASLKSGKPVWNVVIVKNSSVNTDLKVSYRAYGGPYSRNGRKLIEWLADREQEFLEPGSWDEIEDIPNKFLPAFHYHLLRDIYGNEYITDKLEAIENAITVGNSTVIKNITNEVMAKLASIRDNALMISEGIVLGKVNEVLNKVDRAYLGLDLVANLDLANRAEMISAADPTFVSTMVVTDKYIDKRGLEIFSKIVRDNLASGENTNLGKDHGVIAESLKPTLLASTNGTVIYLDSKRNLRDNAIDYEDMVYPKDYPDNSTFIINRVANNVSNVGGVWLGFNPDQLEAYVGIMAGDDCFRRLKWYKFFTDGTIEDLQSKVEEHIKDTKNPHELTKEQIELDLVENYPVVTEADILSQNPVKKYVTMDTLMYFMAAHLLNLKANLDEDGEVDFTSDLFDKANIIFTPCDKTPEPDCPNRGQLIKTYCDGTEKMARYTDGACGFYDEVMQENSDDCNFFDMPKQGTTLSTRCEGFKKIATVADGRGSSYEIEVADKSEDCGYEKPLPLGTVVGTLCTGTNQTTRYADGEGGTYDVVTAVNSPECGYTEQIREGTILVEYCHGTNKVARVADGRGSWQEMVVGVNVPECGFVSAAPTQAPTSEPPSPTGGPTPPAPPGGNGAGSMTAGTNLRVQRAGDIETMSLDIIGARTEDSQYVQAYWSHPSYRGGAGNLIPGASGMVQISGMWKTGRHEHVRTITNEIFDIVGLPVNRLDIQYWWTSDAGGESNRYQASIERTGSPTTPTGSPTSAPTSPPPPSTTMPPTGNPLANAKMTIKMEYSKTVRVSVTGITPGTRVDLKINKGWRPSLMSPGPLPNDSYDLGVTIKTMTFYADSTGGFSNLFQRYELNDAGDAAIFRLVEKPSVAVWWPFEIQGG